jgi:glycosyltransferase involved in cell wall biosynthesis
MAISAMPRISIIMAVRNTALYLPACLDSVRAQSFRDWELVAVNDSSSDASRTILAAYAAKDKRIRLFDSPGRRLNPALQEGYRQARGSLLNRMDSDDIMPPEKLAIMHRTWCEHGRGSVVVGATRHFVDEGEVGQGFRRYDEWLQSVARQQSHYREIYRECTIPSHCWLMHSDDFSVIGGFQDIYPEDYDLAMRIYARQLKIISLDKILHYWRDRQERISRTWEEYRDNRFFGLKVRYFLRLDRDEKRPLLLWGAGRNGKDMAKLLLANGQTWHWFTDNQRKIGEEIYGIRMEDEEKIPDYPNGQIMIVISARGQRQRIIDKLARWRKMPQQDYWFFL